MVAYKGPVAPEKALGFGIPLDQALDYQGFLKSREPVIVGDLAGAAAESRGFLAKVSPTLAPTGSDGRSFLSVPLLIRDRVIGVLRLDHAQPGFYEGRHARLARAIADQVAIALEHARLYRMTRKLASEEKQ